MLPDASSDSREGASIELDLQRAWDSLPEEILWNILMRLPMAAKCRFRSVCCRWRAALSAFHSSAWRPFIQVESKPVCTVVSNTKNSGSIASLFDHTENRWYRIPLLPESLMHLEWRLRGGDGGLLCYDSYSPAISLLLVCNPMNGSFQLVRPKQEGKLLHPKHPSPKVCSHFVDFSVDLETKSYRIVLMHALAVVIFDSKTQDWKRFKRTSMEGKGYRTFVYKNVIYISTRRYGVYVTFDMASGLWSEVEWDVLWDDKICRVVSSKDEVMIVHIDQKHEDSIRTWRWVDAPNSPSHSKWEEVAIKVPDSVRSLVKETVEWWVYGNEFLCFATQYTFSTKTWRVMPQIRKWRSRRRFGRGHNTIAHKWFNWWEPRVDIYVGSGNFKVSDYPELGTSK